MHARLSVYGGAQHTPSATRTGLLAAVCGSWVLQSLHYFIPDTGMSIFAVGPGSCSETPRLSAPVPPLRRGPSCRDVSICLCLLALARRAKVGCPVPWGGGSPGLTLPPLQPGLRSRALGLSSKMPGPGRSSWQPKSRRHRPCWPWTQVGWALPLLWVLVPEGKGCLPFTPACLEGL